MSVRTNAGDISLTGVAVKVSSPLGAVDQVGGVAVVSKTPVVIGGGAGDHFNPTSGTEYLR